MIHIEKRVLKTTTTYRVTYRRPGSRAKETAGTFTSEAEAQRFVALCDTIGLAEALAFLNSPQGNSAPVASRTVAEQIQHHLDHLTGVESGHRRKSAGRARLHINPHLGSIPIEALTRDHVRAWIRLLEDSSLKPKTIKNIHSVLSEALTSAEKEGLIYRNVAKGVRLPAVQSIDHVYLTEDELWRLIALTPEFWQPLVQLLGCTGMRWGEATALRVGDISNGEIRISRAWKDTGGDGHRLGTTKSSSSTRTIPVPTACERIVAELIEGRPKGELLFLNRQGNPVRHASFHDTVWQPLVCEFAGDTRVMIQGPRGKPKRTWEPVGTGRRPRIHDLRHTYASLAISKGWSLPLLSEILGHHSITITKDTYGHLYRADRDAFKDVISAPGAKRLLRVVEPAGALSSGTAG